jgi:hypothetical protein
MTDMHAARHARPRGHLRAYILAGLAALLAGALATAIGTGLVTFDRLPGVTGISVGTDTRSCSVDLIANAVTWGCENTR